MQSYFRRLMGVIKAQEQGNEIIISGINGNHLVRDISKHWKTTRIAANIFNHASSSELRFYKFFAPDFLYILDSVMQYRSRYISVKTAVAIRAAMIESTWIGKAFAKVEPNAPGRLDFTQLGNLKFTPNPEQMDYFKSYNHRLDQWNLTGDLLHALPGTGKAQPLTAKIKVPGGWTTMGDIEVGDMVTAADGTATKVTAIYPQGKKQIYTITFQDGRTTEACAEHLWRVYSKKWRTQTSDGWRIINTEQIMTLMLTGEAKRYYIQLCKPEDMEPVQLPIDPYHLGAILGDGGISANAITLTSGDPELFDIIQKDLPQGLQLNNCSEEISKRIVNPNGKADGNQYTTALRTMGLMGTNSLTKYIPGDYLNASADQRWALLQGLMDTDGTVDVNSNLSYSSSSYILAKGVQSLVRSLGGHAKIRVKETTYVYNGVLKNGAPSWRVAIRFSKPSMCFRLARKLARCNDDNQYTNLRLRIEHINVARREEAQCISVEHPDHLYVTDDYIVTHNTYMSYAIGECLKAEHIVIFCEKRAVETVWEDEANDIYNKKQTLWHTVSGKPYKGERIIVVHYAALQNFLQLVQTGIFKGKKIMTALDECHNMNDPKSLQTQLYVACVKGLGSPDNILASGTPVKALGAELITLMTVADPLFIPEVEARFRLIFGKEGGKGLDIIRHRMGYMSFFIDKNEKTTGLKPPIMKPYKIQIPNGNDFTLDAIKIVMGEFIKERVKYYRERKPQDEKFWADCLRRHEATLKTKDQQKAYVEYLRVLKIVIKNPDPRFTGEEIKATNKYEKFVFGPSLPSSMIHEFRDVKSAIKYPMLKIQGETLGRILGGKRIECHVAMVPHVDWVGIVESTQKKTIMFTSFVEALETSEAHVRKLGMTPIAVYGKTSNELASIVKRFDKEPKLNPLLATYASLATAVRLTMADTMLILNSPFRSYILEQAIARIYRIGQDSQTVVYTAVLDTGEAPNISTRSADILAWSQAMVEEITGVKSPFEQKEAFESFVKDNPNEFDEHLLVHGVLQRSFEQFDITIDKKQFELPKKTTARVPAWMRT